MSHKDLSRASELLKKSRRHLEDFVEKIGRATTQLNLAAKTLNESHAYVSSDDTLEALKVLRAMLKECVAKERAMSDNAEEIATLLTDEAESLDGEGV